MISAYAPDVGTAIRGLKAADRDVRRAVLDEAIPRITAVWQRGVSSHTRSTVDRLVFSDAKVLRGIPPTLVAGASVRKLSGGANLAELARPQEFGGNRNRMTRYWTTSRHKGGYGGVRKHPVTRHTQRQLPRRAPNGRVAYPAAAGAGPAAVAIWCDLITRHVAEAALGEQSSGI